MSRLLLRVGGRRGCKYYEYNGCERGKGMASGAEDHGIEGWLLDCLISM